MKQKKNNKQTDTNNATREDGVKTIAKANASTPQDRIRQRAYEIHQARGGAPGQDLDDWLQAEREIKAEVQKASASQATPKATCAPHPVTHSHRSWTNGRERPSACHIS
jgi:hypothetical protein